MRLDTSAAGTKAHMPNPFPGKLGRAGNSLSTLSYHFEQRFQNLEGWFQRKQKTQSPAHHQQEGSPSEVASPRSRASRVRFGVGSQQQDPESEGGVRLSEAIQNQLYEAISVSAMQFEGYVMKNEKAQVCTCSNSHRAPDVARLSLCSCNTAVCLVSFMV